MSLTLNSSISFSSFRSRSSELLTLSCKFLNYLSLRSIVFFSDSASLSKIVIFVLLVSDFVFSWVDVI